MNNELLLLIKKHTDKLIEQTKTKPQETLEFKMIRPKQTFSFNTPINLVEEDKWLLTVSLFDCTNSVFNITDGNNSFSINIPGRWESKSAEKTIDDLNKFLELRSENGIELHVEEVKKRFYQIIIVDKKYKLSEFFTLKEEILKGLKNDKHKDLEDMVYRFQLTYDEIINILDFKYVPTKRIGYILKADTYQINDINNTLKIFYPIMWK